MLPPFVRLARSLALVGVTAGYASLACDSTGAARVNVEFDAARAWKHLEAQVALGPRPAGSEALEQLRVYLESELRSAGLEPKRESFDCPEAPYGPIKVTNVSADIVAPGADASKLPIIVLCTHFDTKRMGFPFVGANDGASSTAVVLELARVLAADPSSRVVWRVLFLDGEEAIRPEWQDPDNRYGSRHHVKALVERGEEKRVKACILLDMIGDAKLVLTRDSYSDARLFQVLADAAKALGLEQHLGRTPELVKDDHLSFIAAGVPSLDLIDFDYGPRNAYWHSKDDTVEHCSRESLDVIGRLVLASRSGWESFAAH